MEAVITTAEGSDCSTSMGTMDRMELVAPTTLQSSTNRTVSATTLGRSIRRLR
jgi:hypothetical protein